jgi:hypothetical protein
LQQHPGNVYAYDVRVSTSADAGATWSRPLTPHDDDTPTEHGFVSMVGVGSQPYAVWLDGRNTAGDGHAPPEHASAGGAMTLRGAALGQGGSVTEGREIDGRVCDCCQTDAVRAGNGVLVVYRDRSENETRDIYVARMQDGRWSAPLPVHEDGWRLDGCPVNGPAVDARGNQVAVAWFTAPDQPRVRLAFSDDAGKTFAAPIEVANGKVVGRVDVVMLGDGRAVTSWLEEVAGGSEVRARVFTERGAAGPVKTIARSAIDRSSGFPQMIFDGQKLLFAWTQTGDPSRVQTATATLD